MYARSRNSKSKLVYAEATHTVRLRGRFLAFVPGVVEGETSSVFDAPLLLEVGVVEGETSIFEAPLLLESGILAFESIRGTSAIFLGTEFCVQTSV